MSARSVKFILLYIFVRLGIGGTCQGHKPRIAGFKFDAIDQLDDDVPSVPLLGEDRSGLTIGGAADVFPVFGRVVSQPERTPFDRPHRWPPPLRDAFDKRRG